MTYRGKSEVGGISIFFPLFFIVIYAVCQGANELLCPKDVLTLVRDRGNYPIRIAELPILAGALEPTTVIAGQVHKVNNVGPAFRANQEAGRAIEELAVKRLCLNEEGLM